jgi:hypothetical protein
VGVSANKKLSKLKAKKKNKNNLVRFAVEGNSTFLRGRDKMHFV